MIGTTNRHKFYIVRKADEGTAAWPNSGPTSQSDFHDYSGRWVTWLIKGNVSQVLSFEGILVGEVDTDDIKKGNLLYVMSGLGLVGKFVIDRPIFKNDKTIEIKGFQSTGSEQENKKLLSMSTSKYTFEQDEQRYIFGGIVSNGNNTILSDTNGNNIIRCSGMDGSTDRYNLSLDYDNRILSVTKACQIVQKEWTIIHGNNGTYPYADGDSIEIMDRAGHVSSHTFYLTGVHKNCSFSTGNDEQDSMVNDSIVKGSNQTGAHISSHIYDATDIVTSLSGAMDSWLYEDLEGGWDVMTIIAGIGTIEPGEKGIGHLSGAYATFVSEVSSTDWNVSNVEGTFTPGELIVGQTSGATFSYNGWSAGVGCGGIKVHKGGGITLGGYIKIDSERIEINDINFTDPNYDLLRVAGQDLASQFGRGKEDSGGTIMGTEAVPHKAGADVVNLGTPTFLIPVVSTSGFATSGGTRSIRVGSEVIHYIGHTPILFICDGRDWNNSYSHGKDIRVSQHFANGNTYDPDNPQVGVNSIYVNGPQSQTISENMNASHDELDRKAQCIIENRNEVTRIKLNASDYFNTWSGVSLGDSVILRDVGPTNIVTPLSDGQGDYGLYRIMGFEYSFEYGRIALILFLNENETRTWAQTEYTYPNEADEVDQAKRQQPTRKSDENRFNQSPAVGSEQNMSTYSQIKNVTDPVESFDAVNKKYVDTAIGGSVSTDELVKSDAADPTADYLYNKLLAGTGISLTLTAAHLVEISSAAGAGYWTYVAPNLIQPNNSSWDVVPHDSVSNTLGTSTRNWNTIYGKTFRTDFAMSAWVCNHVGTANSYIYNPSGDLILNVGGNIVPSGTRDLGVTGNYWNNVRAYDYYVGTSGKIEFDSGTSSYIDYSAGLGISFYDLGVLRAWFTNQIYFGMNTNILASLSVSYDLDVGGHTTLGNAAGDSLFVNASVESDIIPMTDSAYKLGSAGYYWSHIGVDRIWTTQISEPGGVINLYVGATNLECSRNFIPTINLTQNLGSTTRYWQYLYVWYAYINNNVEVSGNIEIWGLSYFYSDVAMYYDLAVSGNLTVSGTKSCVVLTDDGPVTLSCVESPETKFQEFGSSQLSSGSITINLEEIFLKVTEDELPHIILTPTSDCKGLFIFSKTSSSFTVKELNNGTSDSTFDYIITKTRIGYKNIRYSKEGENGNKYKGNKTSTTIQ